jgi:hypothetical protein
MGAIFISIMTDQERPAAERERFDNSAHPFRHKGVPEQLMLLAEFPGLPAALIGGRRSSA